MKKEIFFLLINFSSEQYPLDSRYLYQRIYDTEDIPDEKLKVFQRKLTYIIQDIQDEEYKKMEKEKPYYVILSNAKGYYVARTYEEAIRGKDFLYERVKPIVIRTNQIKKMIQNKFHQDTNEPDFFI